MAIKNDLILLKNDLSALKEKLDNNLISKGAVSGNTLNASVDNVASIKKGYDFSVLGYDTALQDKCSKDIEDSIAHSEQIKNSWDATQTSLSTKYESDKQLMYFPMVDTQNVTYMYGCFNDCSKLVTIPLLNLSNVTDMAYCFANCSSLATVPELNLSNVTSMSDCFLGCKSLSVIPLLNLSNVTSMSYCFKRCYSLTTVPELNLSNVTDMEHCFADCSKLVTIPPLNLSKVSTMYSCFSYCSLLTTIQELNLISTTSMNQSFLGCRALSYILLKNLGTQPKLTEIDFSQTIWGDDSKVAGSRKSLIDTLITYSFDRKTAGYEACTIKLKANTLGVLTEDEKLSITSKGYTIA